jgi:glycosyltransferase involved in cell wall biosynthesis
MDKKQTPIVFILNGVYKSRCLKRVEEFIDNGYQVEVYGFSWDTDIPNVSDKFKVEVIGHQSVNYSYIKRLSIIVRSLRRIYKKYNGDNVLFYYFFIDVALGAFLINKRPYIYEESDIPYASMRNGLVRKILKTIDKRIIKKSFATIMTSEGFIDYHFGGQKPSNVIIVPNRLNPKIKNLTYIDKTIDMNHLSIGFVGGVRYKSIVNFAEVFVKHFPEYSFHIYGDIEPSLKEKCMELENLYDNIHFHGVFKNPQDLPSIYSQIDLVLATYDYSSVNVRYAEPNKLYEAIYFNTPIIVSSGTFLSRKVERLGIGYAINAMDDKEVVSFIKGLSMSDISIKKGNCRKLPSDYAINHNPELFEFLEQ